MNLLKTQKFFSVYVDQSVKTNIATCFALLYSPVKGDCLDGFQHHGSMCYKILSLEASWIEAKVRKLLSTFI